MLNTHIIQQKKYLEGIFCEEYRQYKKTATTKMILHYFCGGCFKKFLQGQVLVRMNCYIVSTVGIIKEIICGIFG